MAGGSRDGGRTVASKVVQILAAFDERQPLTASEVCRRSGMPFSTVHRLLAGLAADGLLHRSPDGGYSVGIRVWELAAGHPRLRDLHAAALPVMSRLHASLGASVYLHVLVGAEALCVEELRCPDGPTRRTDPVPAARRRRRPGPAGVRPAPLAAGDPRRPAATRRCPPAGSANSCTSSRPARRSASTTISSPRPRPCSTTPALPRRRSRPSRPARPTRTGWCGRSWPPRATWPRTH